MHLGYRNRRQNAVLPLQPEVKLSPYYAKNNNSVQRDLNNLNRKKSIEVILEKHFHRPVVDKTIGHRAFRKNSNRQAKGNSSRSKATSGYLQIYGGDVQQSRGQQRHINRNRSTQFDVKYQINRRRAQGQMSPYVTQKKSRSIGKFRATGAQLHQSVVNQPDWICQRFIQKEVYLLEEPSDFV